MDGMGEAKNLLALDAHFFSFFYPFMYGGLDATTTTSWRTFPFFLLRPYHTLAALFFLFTCDGSLLHTLDILSVGFLLKRPFGRGLTLSGGLVNTVQFSNLWIFLWNSPVKRYYHVHGPDISNL